MAKKKKEEYDFTKLKNIPRKEVSRVLPSFIDVNMRMAQSEQRTKGQKQRKEAYGKATDNFANSLTFTQKSEKTKLGKKLYVSAQGGIKGFWR